jgi:hypothetical protein
MLQVYRSSLGHLEQHEQNIRARLLRDAASVIAVRLVDLSLQSARICLVSTQLAGKPASTRALNDHCDSGPASA